MSDWIIWLVAGLVLLMLEIHAPGAFMMWLGLAACGTGLVVLADRHRLRASGGDVRRAGGDLAGHRSALSLSPAAGMNTQQSGLAGRSATALSFQGREGRVRVGDSDWAARVPTDVAEPAPGSRLRVEGVDGTVLIVRPER